MKTHLLLSLSNFFFNRRHILFLALLLGGHRSFAQSEHIAPAASAVAKVYDYYLDIRGTDTKEKCNKLTELVRTIKGITYFETRQFPGKYFTLLASAPISKAEVENLLGSTEFKIVYFATGRRELKLLLLNRSNIK